MSSHSRAGNQGDSGAAPPAVVLRDLQMMRSRDLLRTNWETEELILIQSLEGRAHGGHGQFKGRRYPNTTEDDLARALHLDPAAVRRKRQSLIGQIGQWVERAVRGETEGLLLTADQAPLLGIGTFALLKVDTAEVLRGLYLGGLRDTLEVRTETERRYGVQIGAGKLYRVDAAVMQRMGLTGESLAHDGHADRIEEYRRIGLIVDAPPSAESTIRYLYIRHHAGPGASDDAAIVCGGLRFGADAAIGVFLADAIDTLEKYVPSGQEGDQDAALARHIEEIWPELGVGLDEVCELTFLSVGGEGLPDSSLRHLLRVDRQVDQCALEAHLLKASGRPFASLELGHERVLNDEFYAVLDGRVSRLRHAPEPGARTRH